MKKETKKHIFKQTDNKYNKELDKANLILMFLTDAFISAKVFCFLIVIYTNCVTYVERGDLLLYY